NKFQGFVFDLVTHRVFNIIIMVLICFQATTIMIQNDEQSVQMETAVYWMESGFVMLFTLECILKLIAFRCHYFTNVWNVHDFMVVIFSITVLLGFRSRVVSFNMGQQLKRSSPDRVSAAVAKALRQTQVGSQNVSFYWFGLAGPQAFYKSGLGHSVQL
ncbi:hypothetical protein A6R68_15897, partial [Neotoma lepida]